MINLNLLLGIDIMFTWLCGRRYIPHRTSRWTKAIW